MSYWPPEPMDDNRAEHMRFLPAKRHAAYPDGPLCSAHCPGEWSEYHDGYGDGHAASTLSSHREAVPDLAERLVRAMDANAAELDAEPWSAHNEGGKRLIVERILSAIE